MFRVTVKPLFEGREPDFYYFESAELLATFLVRFSHYGCVVERV
jgi:hypothetical protein